MNIKEIKKYVSDFVNRADMFLLVMCLICAVFGTFMVRKATMDMWAGGWFDSYTKYVVVQVLSIFLGIAAFVVFTVIDGDILGENWRWLCVFNVLILVALIFFGQDDGTGNRSWIRFAGIGVQPSEIVKVLFIIVMAKQMTVLREKSDINSFMSIAQMVAHFVAVFGLIVVVSSDLGSAMIILCIFLVMFFMLGVHMYWFAVGGAAVAAAIPLLWTYFLKTYQKKRILAPYDASIDPDGWGITWQTTQSKFTLASGQLTGMDEGHTPTVFTGKHTDFIFSCTGENLGMIGCIIIIILLSIIIIHCMRVGINSGRLYDMLVCTGVSAALAFQTFINIGMNIGITPVIGITLPFFSYGGSSMVTLFAAVGLVSGVKYKPKAKHVSMIYREQRIPPEAAEENGTRRARHSAASYANR